jgi:hypothetical protein
LRRFRLATEPDEEFGARAELLIRLGRQAEATQILDELDAGIAKGIGAYPSRTRRVLVLRALQAVIEGRDFEARRFASRVDGGTRQASDDNGRLARMLAAVAAARMGRRAAVPAVEGEAIQLATRELMYWRGTALLALGRPDVAGPELEAVLATPGGVGGAEAEWRVAALTAVAWHRINAHEKAIAQSSRAAAAFSRVRESWGEQADGYAQRPDVRALIQQLQGVSASPPAPLRPGGLK